MSSSILDLQHDAILKAIREATAGQWRVLILDEDSQRLIGSVVKDDEILGERITHIERIERRRAAAPDTDAVYLLTPEAHIVDCVVAEVECRKYRGALLLWTALLPEALRERIAKLRTATNQNCKSRVLDIGIYARESHLITFKDPWSFPILFHPACNDLVKRHVTDLAQRIVAACVLLGEYPTIRYYDPTNATHEAKVLCRFLAGLVQKEIDKYATFHNDFPPASSRPRAVLYILDRSLDLFAPVLHEFTYQAMVHDLLPIKDGDQTSYKVTINEGRTDQEQKDVVFGEKDKIWTANRHKHMKDTIERLMGDFQRFLDDNPHYNNPTAGNDANSLNVIRDMMIGLPQFQETKEAYSLHLTMAQESMNAFQRRKLADLATLEQSLATGLDEEYKKPKNLADQLVRMLDESSVGLPDRLRLIILYLLYRDGLLTSDTSMLLAHASLPSKDFDILENLSLLGANVSRGLKDSRPQPQPLFARKQAPPNLQDDYSLSRFEPVLKQLLKAHTAGSLDEDIFPYTKPQLEASDANGLDTATRTSLRSAKPTWAKTRANMNEPKQRVMVFMAGGATYSESRACAETTMETSKDIYLLTSHMLTPSLFIRQVSDLSVDRRKLGIPADQPAKQPPAHVFEDDNNFPAPKPPSHNGAKSAPLTSQLANLSVAQNGAQRLADKPVQQSRPPPSSRDTKSYATKDAEKKKGFGIFSKNKPGKD